jgi:hypothetical protein
MIPNRDRFYQMKFASVYPLYIKKAERKGRTKGEVDAIILWLTGFDESGIAQQLERQNNFETFFQDCPNYNPNANKVRGTICGYRIEEIQDPLIQKVRILDKLIDDLAKGKKMEKILQL